MKCPGQKPTDLSKQSCRARTVESVQSLISGTEQGWAAWVGFCGNLDLPIGRSLEVGVHT